MNQLHPDALKFNKSHDMIMEDRLEAIEKKLDAIMLYISKQGSAPSTKRSPLYTHAAEWAAQAKIEGRGFVQALAEQHGVSHVLISRIIASAS
jgi:hypothetical protein